MAAKPPRSEPAAETDPPNPEEGPPIALAAWEHVRGSVLNYGVPALAGRMRTAEEFTALAGAVEEAIMRFEPCLRQVRVSLGESAEHAGLLTSPFEMLIEGELWGYPLPEQLVVRTVIDLDLGRVQVATNAALP